ncbi:MAG: VOC family protein [Kangiellaceae bacterium]|nr:VOC family protein [Kangiellaceae bacterium]
MIGYITVGTNNIEKAVSFFDELFSVVGVECLWKTDGMAAWGKSREEPAICVARPFDKQQASVGNGVMVALKMASKEQVDCLHAKALELGASNEGDVGPRGTGGFYGGYFRDLDGNKFSAYIPSTSLSS